MPKPMRILVAEDCEVSRRSVITQLAKRFPDATILEASDYGQARKSIGTVDVCVLDLFLGSTPVEDVLDLIYDNPDIQVVAYSASCDADLAERACEAGAVQFISKSCPPVMLPVSVAMAMRMRRRLLELGRASDEATQQINETLALLGAG